MATWHSTNTRGDCLIVYDDGWNWRRRFGFGMVVVVNDIASGVDFMVRMIVMPMISRIGGVTCQTRRNTILVKTMMMKAVSVSWVVLRWAKVANRR